MEARHSFYSFKGLIVLFVISTIIRAILFCLTCHQPLNIVDEQHYNRLAMSIIQRGEFAHFPGHPTASRPPLYPFFLAVLYKIGGLECWNIVRVVQVIISLLSGMVFHMLALDLFKEKKVAFWSAAIFLFYPSLIFFNYLILTETLFIFLFLSSIFLLVKGLKDCKNWMVFLGGILLGASSLTRSISYPLTIVLFIFFVFFAIKEKNTKMVVHAVALVVGVVVAIVPWAYRNYKIFHAFVPIDTTGGRNFYMGNYEHTPLHRAWAAVDNPPEIAWYRGHEKELRGLNEAEKQKWAIKKAKEFILDHPGLTLLRSVIKAANFWQLERTIIAGMSKGHFPGLKGPIKEALIATSILAAYVFVAILGFSGVFLKLWHDPKWTDFLILVILLYFTGIHALVFGHSRYHLPLIPFLCGYAAWFVINLKALYAASKVVTAKVTATVTMVFFAIWAYDAFIGSKEKVMAFLNQVF